MEVVERHGQEVQGLVTPTTAVADRQAPPTRAQRTTSARGRRPTAWRRARVGLRRLLGIRDNPHSVARGVSVGLFIALTPTLGGQIILVLIACLLVRANRVAGLAMVWVTNPLTIVPFCWIWYRIGILVTGDPPISYQQMGDLLPSGKHGILDSMREVFATFGPPLWVGALIMGTVTALLAYPLTLYCLRRRAVRRAQAWEAL